MNMIVISLKHFPLQTFFLITLTNAKKEKRNIAFNSMRKLLFQITALLSFTVFGVHAQEVIISDVTKGCDELTVLFTLDNAYGIDIYSSIEWDFGDGGSAPGVLSVEHTYTSPGIFSVTCLLDGGRRIKRDTFIRVSETPYADFKYQLKSENEGEYEYSFEPSYFEPLDGIDLAYTWRFPDGTELNDRIADYSFEGEGDYLVFFEIIDEIGCFDDTTKRITISDTLLVEQWAFSPNGDNINDYFEVPTSEDYAGIFRIFTRNGKLIYTSDSPQVIWDGKAFGGQYVPEGIYYYTIQIEKPKISVVKGYIYVFR
jgi:gliding motility-associated-like protein